MTFARLQNGVYQVYDDREQLLGTVHRGTDPMPRRWYAYGLAWYVGACATRKNAANLLQRQVRRLRRRHRTSSVTRPGIRTSSARPPRRP
jgi:hypothetical protein